ncbi:MAG: hypothetical protein ACRCX2_28630 [Paraclostridium sp.]
MKLQLETKYNIFDEVKYKKIDTFAVFENGDSKEDIKNGKITTIDIQVGMYGNIYVNYGMENEDTVCSDCIIDIL